MSTQIYAHYAPSEREVDMVNRAFDSGEAAPVRDAEIAARETTPSS